MQPLDPRVEIGHVRLTVADLERALAFYAGSLGFDVSRRDGASSARLGSGGVRHHIVLTAIAPAEDGSCDDPPRQRFAIRFPDRAALGDTLLRLEQAGVAVERTADDGTSESLFVHDPDGHEVELYYDRSRAVQPADSRPGETFLSGTVDLDALRAASRPAASDVSASTSPAPLTDASRQRLRDLRTRLLHLHKVLLDDARTAYEMDRGRVGSNASLLQLVINDPWFAWLHSLSEMVVRIDEMVEQGAPATQPDGMALVDQVEKLLTASESGDGFARRYYEALQRQPAVVLAHADVRRTLKSMR
jgi:catechol 2,3-dioxygenase-like lactoylglutathione lyase family enzyme